MYFRDDSGKCTSTASSLDQSAGHTIFDSSRTPPPCQIAASDLWVLEHVVAGDGEASVRAGSPHRRRGNFLSLDQSSMTDDGS
jgi:hypothetical protein